MAVAQLRDSGGRISDGPWATWGLEVAKIYGSFTSPKNASKWQLAVMGGGSAQRTHASALPQ
jgi:hypothetical protein